LILAAVVLSGCTTHQPVWQDRQRVIIVSGKDMAGASQDAAVQRMLARSARVTVDHGFRYFTIVRPVPAPGGPLALRPGADVTIRLFRQGETEYPAPGVWDAYGLLNNRRAESGEP